MMLGFLLAMMGSGIEPAAVTDHFDAIELNSYYDENGKHVFDQLIYRDFGEISDWRLVKCVNQLPTGRKAIWFDGTCLRKVSATSVYHTWTQTGVTGDPELEARKEHPKESRRELTSPRTTKQRAQELINHGRRNDHHPHHHHPETP